MSEPEIILMNGVERNRKNPNTFSIPPEYQRRGVVVGMTVKIGLCDSVTDRGERFWVEVVRVDGEVYTGTVQNELVVLSPELGEEIELGPEHVLGFYVSDEMREAITESKRKFLPDFSEN